MDTEAAHRAVHAVRERMEAEKDHLLALDGRFGDGDLGLTMTKAFAAADEEVLPGEKEPGRYLAEVGMTIARAAPSTLATLIGTGFMRGGKAVGGKDLLAGPDLAVFFRAFADGLRHRGKCQPGEKTILDVIEPVADALAGREEALPPLASAAIEAARAGEQAARGMVARQGRAAFYQEQTRDQVDAGAYAGLCLVEAFCGSLQGEEGP
jgi:dihydroxyacetone kinase-like protein